MPTIGPATYNLLVAQVRHRVVDYVTRTFAGLESWRDADVVAFVDAVVPVVTAGQRQIATLTDNYLTSQLAELYGTSAAPLGVDLDSVSGSAVRNGADPKEVYRRPFVNVYKSLKEGNDLHSAVQQGVLRAQQLSGTDLQLAKTHATRQVMSVSPATYYRRVLSGSENCAMCTIASTQRYKKSSLLPIHPGCDCGVQPIKGNSVPHTLDRGALEAAHKAIAAHTGKESDRTGRGDGVDARKLILVREHGEMGPLLTVKRDAFTGPSGVHE